MKLKKPRRLNKGDTIATVSISHGWAGDKEVLWKYELGKKILEEAFKLNVVAAPNSMKGTKYLSENPQARAEDIMWAFENKNIKAVIANVGGNDSIRVIPYIKTHSITENPKIFIGYSDIQNIHLLCYKSGLSTFYGHNLLSTIADVQGLHPYCEKWFRKVLFDISPVGPIEPPVNWTCDSIDYFNKNHYRRYQPCSGYELIQGKGCVTGRLFGGHTGIMEVCGTQIELTADDFTDKILFIEDIPEFFSPADIGNFFRWLGNMGALQKLKGVIIGKLNQDITFDDHKSILQNVVNNEFGMNDLPILYGVHIGHSSPICILPYGVNAEIDCENAKFSILESGVI